MRLSDIDPILHSLRHEGTILRDIFEDPDPRLVQLELEHRWLNRLAPTYALESSLVFRHLGPNSAPVTFTEQKTRRQPQLIVIGHAFPAPTQKAGPTALLMPQVSQACSEDRDRELFVKYRLAQILSDCKTVQPTTLKQFRIVHGWTRDALRWLKTEQHTLKDNLRLVRWRSQQPDNNVRDQYDAPEEQ